MAIKMRTNKKSDAVCEECGCARDKALDMFDLYVFGEIHTICDKCDDALLSKTLSAICYVNGRAKGPKDMQIIRSRAHAIGFKDGGKHLSINEAMKE